MDMYPKTVLQFNPMAPYLSLLKALSRAVPSVLGVDTVQDREPWHSLFAMPAAVSKNEAWFLPRTLTTARAGQKASLLSAASMKPFLDRKRRERKEREGKRASVNKKERKKEGEREERDLPILRPVVVVHPAIQKGHRQSWLGGRPILPGAGNKMWLAMQP